MRILKLIGRKQIKNKNVEIDSNGVFVQLDIRDHLKKRQVRNLS